MIYKYGTTLIPTVNHSPISKLSETMFSRFRLIGAIPLNGSPWDEWLTMVAWLSGNALVSINEVTLRRARLLLGWVTVCERVNDLGM